MVCLYLGQSPVCHISAMHTVFSRTHIQAAQEENASGTDKQDGSTTERRNHGFDSPALREHRPGTDHAGHNDLRSVPADSGIRQVRQLHQAP